MTTATTAEVKSALRSLLAHLQPFDVDRNHYKRRVIARLKEELLPKKPNKAVEKKRWFCDWADDAFNAYIINFQVIILLQKEIVFEYESENSIGDIGSSDNEGVISEYVSNLEQSELAPNRNITVTIFEKMKRFEYELNTNTGTVGCSSHRDLASNYKLDPNRLESAPVLPVSVTF